MTDVTKIDAFFQSSPHPAWLATSRGECLYVNPALERLIGLKSDQINHVDWCSFVLEEDRVAASASWQRSLTSGTPYRATVRLRGFDGVPASVELIAFGHTLHDGTELWLFTGLNLHGATQQYPGLEAQLQATLNVIPAYTWYALPSGGLTFVNERAADSLGLPKDHPLRLGIDTGAKWDAHIPFLHPDDREEARRVWSVCMSTGSAGENSQRVRNAQGEYRWFLSRAEPLRASDGTLLYWIGVNLDIEERKQAEEQLVKSAQELQRSEAYLAEAQRLSHTGSFGWNPDTGEIVWSDETYRIFEYDRGTKPNLDMLMERLHPQDCALFQQVIDRASRAATDFEHEYRLLLVEGRVKHVHAIARALQDASGSREFIGAVTDITERKTAEEKILRNERELRTLVEIMPAYVGTSLPDGAVDFLSQSWLDYSGQTREEVMGWGWAGTMHPDDVDRVLANWQAGVASGEPVEQELRCRRADGVYHWFLNRSLPLRDDEGRITKWFGILFDVNALKETESALRTREHELLGIIETIPSMLWSTWPSGEPHHLSQRMLEYFGSTLEELANRGWVSFIHPDDREETAETFFRAMETGESYNVINRMRRADGEYRWHQTRGEPLRDLRGQIIQWYGLTIDIDERKKAEDHLRDTRIKLAKASRLATVAELAGSIAHELNQPLMSILANAQAAKKWLNATPPNVAEVNSSIERTIRDARAADETMQHIRALFKQESFDKKDINIPKILREVVRVVQEDPKKRGIPIEYHFEESLPAIHVDQIQIQQVFINLIVNAIEALEGQQLASLVVLRAVTDSNGMLIQVIDNGPGVDDPDRIFDAFMTTKEKGMGIGLAVSRTIVEAHGGQLWAENNKTGGSIFNVSLPLSQAVPRPLISREPDPLRL
jgi:PAS domain S-box-containing protein